MFKSTFYRHRKGHGFDNQNANSIVAGERLIDRIRNVHVSLLTEEIPLKYTLKAAVEESGI